MIKLYIDFDGVILDTITYTANEMKDLNINDDEKRREYFENVDWHELIKSSPEVCSSISCIKRISDSKLYDISILTHVYSKKEEYEKDKYLKKVLPLIDVIYVPKIKHKSDIVNPIDTILIDDYLPNCLEWNEQGGIGVKLSSTNREVPCLKITKLDEIIELYDKIKEIIEKKESKV